MTCDQCGRTMDERIETIWQLVEGWEKKRAQGGTNHLAMRNPKEKFRCNGCMQLMLDGLSSGQVRLDLG